MKRLSRFLMLFFIFSVLYLDFSHAIVRKRMELDPVTTKELFNIVRLSKDLQKYMYEKKDPLVQTQVSLLKANIDKTLKTIESTQGQHISKMLKTINQDLVNAQSVTGKDRVKFLQSAFKQLVMLYQSYKIEAPYKVFFCQVDRSVWIQEGNKPQNPFIENSKCGRPVN